MQHSRYTSALLAVLLLSGPMVALADRDDRRDPRRGWDDRGRWEQQAHRDRRAHRSYRDHRYRQDRFRHRGWWSHPGARYWRRGGYHAPPAWRFRYYDDRGAAFLGGALIGSAFTQSLLHDRGDHRRCDHDRTTIVAPGACYRIERLPDGRERRVELPASACRW